MSKKNIIAIVIIAVMLVTFIFFYLPKFSFTLNTNDINLISEWYCIDENGERIPIALPEIVPRDNDGNFTMSTILPDAFSTSQIICFYTRHQTVYVTLGNKLIYVRNNSNSGSFGESTSPCWNMVEVNDKEAAGQELTIMMSTPYEDIKLHMTEVVFGKLDQVHVWLENSFGFYMFMDGTFAWIGVLFILLSFFHRDNARNRAYQRYAGIILIFFAGYMRTMTKALQIYFLNDFSQEFIGFFCLFALPIPLILYVRTRVIRKPRMVYWCNWLVLFSAVSAVTLFVLHGFGVIDIHRYIYVASATLMVTLLTGILFGIYYYVKHKNRFLPLTLISLFLIMCMLFLEHLYFYRFGNMPFDMGFFTRMIAVLVIVIETFIYVYYLHLEMKRRDQVNEENRNLRIQMFSTQIKPHFILNTVGAIRTLIKTDGDKASELLYEFSKYIRTNLEEKDYTKYIPFLEELDYIETYLKLEKARFGDRINVEYDIENKSFWVLPLTIQPFVENAVKHGLFPSANGGTLKISTRSTAKGAVVIIQDNGVGFDAYRIQDILETKKSMGMKSSILRIEKEMGGKVIVESSCVPGDSGTKITIELPLRGKKNENDNR